MSQRALRCLCPALIALAAACGGAGDAGPASIRLVDRFTEATVSGSPPLAEVSPAVWDFAAGTAPEQAESGPSLGWSALHEVADLQVRDGLLSGRVTGDVPLLRISIPEGMLEDELHAIEVRARISAGERLAAFLTFGEKDRKEDLAQIVADMRGSRGGMFSAEIDPSDDELSTYILPVTSFMASSMQLSRVTGLELRPGEVAGTEFAIESVRVVSRREHFGTIPSGVAWQDQSDVFREVLVSRTPESLSFDVQVPTDPWLELHLGTIEPGPARFVVSARDGAGDAVLLQRTVSTPERWEDASFDLSSYAGKRVTLTFRAEADKEGTIVYWGTPVIRQRGDRPRATAPSAPRQALAADAPAPGGVLFILADTLRRDHLPWHGGARDNAPNLARIAEQASIFTRNVSQGAWTKVSVSSILTSLYPTSHRVTDLTDRLPSSVTTLEEAFLGAGYATFHTSSVPFTGRLTNLHQGSEVLHEAGSIPELGHASSKSARTYVDRLLPWLESQRDQPWYVFLHIFDPHTPFEPYAPYDLLYMDDEEARAQRERLKQLSESLGDSDDHRFMKSQGFGHAEELANAKIDVDAFVDSEKDWYDASIRAMDVEIGRLLEKLESLGRLDNTLIVFMSDHGEEFLEHGRHFHGYTTYGEMLNVPLMLWWPGVLPPTRVDEIVESIDVYPTVLELARIAVPEQAQGQSLLPLLADPQAPSRLGWQPRPAMAERAIDRGGLHAVEVESYAIVTEEWKLIRNTTRPEGWPEYELYSSVDDPLDQNDVAAEHPDVVEQLAAEIDAWLEMALAERVEETSASDMSPEELARLRSLGYVE